MGRFFFHQTQDVMDLQFDLPISVRSIRGQGMDRQPSVACKETRSDIGNPAKTRNFTVVNHIGWRVEINILLLPSSQTASADRCRRYSREVACQCSIDRDVSARTKVRRIIATLRSVAPNSNF